MKHLLLKTWLVVVCLMVGVGTGWAEDVTIASWGKVSFAANSAVAASSGVTGYNNITLTSDKAITTSGQGNAYYGGSAAGATIIMANVPSDYKIKKVTFYGRASQSGNIAVSYSTDSGSTWTSAGSASLSTSESQKTVTFSSTPSGVNKIKFVHSASTGSLYFGTIVLTGERAATDPYTVTFNAGSNGTCSTSSLTEASVGVGVTLPGVTANDGWSFQGWSTSATPTSADAGAAGATYKPSANTTLYAYYKVIPVAPTFGTAAGEVEKGTEITFSSTTDGCTFRYTTDGTDPDAKTGTQASSCTIISDCTVKVVAVKDGVVSAVSSASYTVAKHTVTFYVNGAQSGETASYGNGDAITFPTDPSIEDVVFMGWTKTADYDNATTAPSDLTKSATMGTEDVTYYAVFAEATVGNTYTQITAANALEVGARYLIVGNSSSTYKALPVDKAETLTTVTPSSSKITNPAEELIWTLEGQSGQWKIKSVSNGKYLQISGGNLTFESSTSLTFNASVSSSKFTFTSSASSGNKVLSYYANGNKFNAYTSANNVYLYKASVDYSNYCTTVKAVTSVAVKTAPTTVAYCEGEKFNPAGLEVTLTYEDATTKDVTYSDATASKFTFAPALDAALAPTDDNVQITINGQSCNQAISVRSVSISVPVVTEGTYTVKVGDAEAVTADGNSINVLKGQKIVLASTPAAGYKLHSTPFVVKDEDDANVSVSTAGGEYSFTMPGKNVTITAQFTRVYTITAGSCEHGSITAIKDKDDAEITETSYRSKVVVEATADTHYHLTGMFYVKEGDDAHNDISETEGVYSFTMPQSNVTVYATFADDTQYTISWMVNGTEAKSEQVYADVPVSAPAVEAINGKVFRGWVAAEIDGTTDETPSFVNVTGLTVSEDKVFYAVFATETGTPETHNIITYETENFPTFYAAAADYTLNGVSFNITQAYVNGQKTQWRASDHTSGPGIMYNKDAMNNLSKITLTYDNSDTRKNFSIYVGNSANPDPGTQITGVKDANDDNVYVFDCSAENANYFVLINGLNAGYLTTIDITCGGATYSAYCTTVDPYEVTLVAQAGGTYYATFSNSDAVEFTDATVQTVNVDEDNIALTEQDVKKVPANTGVLISSTSNKVHYYVISEADALSNNLLKPASEAMTGNFKFYRLAYNNYSDKTGLGFYYGAADGAAFTCKAGTAYLAVPNDQAARGYSFDGEETAIESAIAEQQNHGVIYDLQGRRAQAGLHGIFIVNGKKVVR